jgi:hypothetical protein
MWPVRQIEIYDAGPVLLYGPDLVEDVHGGLGEAALGEIDEWSDWEISATEFDRFGSSLARSYSRRRSCYPLASRLSESFPSRRSTLVPDQDPTRLPRHDHQATANPDHRQVSWR